VPCFITQVPNPGNPLCPQQTGRLATWHRDYLLPSKPVGIFFFFEALNSLENLIKVGKIDTRRLVKFCCKVSDRYKGLSKTKQNGEFAPN
jgi:hypothetical protein